MFIENKYPKLLRLLVYLFIIIILPRCPKDTEFIWSVTERDNTVEIAYGRNEDFPQYAVIHLQDSYFRMNYGPESGWGTSLILLPSFWSEEILHQGAPISAVWDSVGSNLVISFTGTISSLTVYGEVIFEPPEPDSIKATVVITDIEGDVILDNRPGEAFKPAMLSSMHISDSIWDACSAYVNSQSFPIPQEGWIIYPPVNGIVFGLKGGTSDWKTNATTIEVSLDRTLQITGWVTLSTNPNDDNVGFWAASDEIIRSWQYTVTCKP